MLLTLQPDECFADADRLAALLPQLRAAGARVGWPGELRSLAARPDHVVVPRPAVGDLAGWQHAIDATAARWPGAALLLPELPDVDLLEALLKPPVALAGCAVGTAVARPRSAGVPPQAQRLLQLLNRLVGDHDTALLVADIKADAGLALRLLEHLNTAGAMPGRRLESIDDVVLVLGRSALYRWVAQMLVQLAPPRPAAEALQALALARARLLEALAREAGDPNPGGSYLLGLASALPMLLQCTLDDAIAPLRLPQAAVQALRDGSGPWSAALSLALALERHEMDQAEALAGRYGGLPTVLAHATRAWMPGA
jgi:EAL and modified HD-GYP domain-containing signal transduction protein